MKENTIVLIMAGGIGSRFWPLSTKSKPKQFLDILGTGKTLLQESFDRYAKICNPENIYIITNTDYRELVLEQLPSISDSQILREPFGKNTAACIAYATFKFMETMPEATLIVAPSDHLITDTNEFNSCIEKAHQFAQKDNTLVTLGIKPHRPDTGYGYIQFQEKASADGIHKVKTFTEKPPLDLAMQFLESGDFLWNSGMFVWKIKSILNSFEKLMPELTLAFGEGKGAYNTKIEYEHISRIYAMLNSVSIDNGILEKSDNVYVVPSNFGWSDLGTWKTVLEQTLKEENAALNVDLHSIDSANNLVISDNKKLVVLQGLDGYFVIDTENALLICKNNYEQEIKKVTSDVNKSFKGKYN